MSRIGNLAIQVPAGVTVTVSPENVVTVKGPKGELTQDINADITVTVEDGTIVCSRKSDSPDQRSLHGLSRSLINNMVIGVTEGYKKNA